MRLVLFFSFVVTSLWAQQPLERKPPQPKTPADTVQKNETPNDTLRAAQAATDTVKIKSYANKFSPRRALLLAAILPGTGQIYTRKYWKTPLVWGGFAILIKIAMFHQEQQVYYRVLLFDVLTFKANNPSIATPPIKKYPYSEEALRNGIQRARRERDFFIILNGVWYLLQLVDAHVDAHLKEFKLNPELRLSYEPMIEASPLTGQSVGFRLVMKF